MILGSLTNPYECLEEYRPDILCFGYDQRSFNNEQLEEVLKKMQLSPEIVRIAAHEPEIFKSSKL